jgi:predicted metalloprotease with PDZ domain
VPFGRVVRDGGESIELLVDETRPLEDFYAEWTATHEFAHLLLPYLDREQRWISEGFATYYQNVLLARAGRYTEQAAWRKLVEGFGRGRDSVPSLSPNAAASGAERSTRMKVYWSGAALALIADVELRRRSAGRESLDTVLDQLQRCCLPSSRTWSGAELFAQLDRFVAEPLFVPLYERYADSAGFPAVTPLLTELGVSIEDGDLRLSETAGLAALRRALMAPPAGPGS